MQGEYGLRLTARWITPACQQRGHDVAWEDAVSQLKEVYDAQLARHDKPITLTLAIYRDDARCPQCGSRIPERVEGGVGCPNHFHPEHLRPQPPTQERR